MAAQMMKSTSNVKIFTPDQYIQGKFLSADLSDIPKETLESEYKMLRKQQSGYFEIARKALSKKDIRKVQSIIDHQKRCIKDAYDVKKKFENQAAEIEKVLARIRAVTTVEEEDADEDQDQEDTESDDECEREALYVPSDAEMKEIHDEYFVMAAEYR